MATKFCTAHHKHVTRKKFKTNVQSKTLMMWLAKNNQGFPQQVNENRAFEETHSELLRKIRHRDLEHNGIFIDMSTYCIYT